MPAPDISSASPRYRIKSIAEKHDRIVAESEFAPAKGPSAEMQAAAEQMQLPEWKIEGVEQAKGSTDVLDISQSEPKL